MLLLQVAVSHKAPQQYSSLARIPYRKLDNKGALNELFILFVY